MAHLQSYDEQGQDSHALRQWVTRGSTSQRVRAAIILGRQGGASVATIAAQLGVHPDTVKRWSARYRRDGLAGLAHGNLGQQRRRRFDASTRRAIARLARKPPRESGEPFAEWSLAKFRAYLVRTGAVAHISIETVRHILADAGGRPPGWRTAFPETLVLDPKVSRRLRHLQLDPVFGARAAIILAATEGRPVKVIASDLALSTNTVRRWIKRFVGHGVSALTDAPLYRQPTLFTASVQARMIALAARSPRALGVPRDQWTLPLLRQHLVARGVVRRISIEWLRQILRRAQGANGSAIELLIARRASAAPAMRSDAVPHPFGFTPPAVRTLAARSAAGADGHIQGARPALPPRVGARSFANLAR